MSRGTLHHFFGGATARPKPQLARAKREAKREATRDEKRDEEEERWTGDESETEKSRVASLEKEVKALKEKLAAHEQQQQGQKQHSSTAHCSGSRGSGSSSGGSDGGSTDAAEGACVPAHLRLHKQQLLCGGGVAVLHPKCCHFL